MKTSEAGKEFIKSFESCRLAAYPDPATGGEPWTIGWGRTTGVKRGDTCTQEQADKWFDEEIEQRERDVNFLIKVPLTQYQFDAVMSFDYNVGSDIDDDNVAEGLGDSTLLRLLNQGDYTGAAAQFDKWNRGPYGPLLGLTKRRAAERKMFETGVYENHV